MILKQKDMMAILPQLLQNAQQRVTSQDTLKKVPLLRAAALDLTKICEDIMVLEQLPADSYYYFHWQVTLLEDELPTIDLTLKVVTPSSHHATSVSPQLLSLFTSYFVDTGRIPDPWLIS